MNNSTCQHGVEKDTQGPDVARFPFVQTTGEHLRSNTLWGPTGSLADGVRILVFAETAEQSALLSAGPQILSHGLNLSTGRGLAHF